MESRPPVKSFILRVLSAASPNAQLDDSGRVLGSCFILAAAAGLFSAMVKKLSLRDTLVAAGVSGVGGLVVGAICVNLWGIERWYLTCAACSLAGWAGGNLILDRLAFVAWTIAQGKLPELASPPESPGKEAPADAPPSPPSQAPVPQPLAARAPPSMPDDRPGNGV